MKLTLKITALFLVVACGLVGFSGYLSVQREIAFLEEDMFARHRHLVTSYEKLWLEAWKHGRELPSYTITQDGAEWILTRWVWLDGTGGAVTPPFAPLDRIPTDERSSVLVRGKDGKRLFCSYSPVSLFDGRLGALEISESLLRQDQYIQDTIYRTVILMGTLIAVAMLLVAFFGVRLIGQPLETLIEKTQRVSDGDLRTPVIIRGNDELTTLANALNQMCEKLDASQQAVLHETSQRIEALENLRHEDRLKTVGRLASGVAHELGTPLNVISGRAGLIADGKLGPEDIRKSAQIVQSEATRMTAIVQQLLNFARRSTPKRTICDLNAVVERTITLMEPIFRKHEVNVEVTERISDDVCVNADASQLQQVISNLLTNASLSRDESVNVQIAATTCEAASAEHTDSQPIHCAKITVTDNGGGISEADLPHVFEPFFTTRQVGQGTGLGLSIAYGIVAEHGGWMTVDSIPDQGSAFSVYLPVEKKA